MWVAMFSHCPGGGGQRVVPIEIISPPGPIIVSPEWTDIGWFSGIAPGEGDPLWENIYVNKGLQGPKSYVGNLIAVSNPITDHQLGGWRDTIPGHAPGREDVVIPWSWKDYVYQLLMIFTRWYGSDRMVPGLKLYLGGNLSQTGNRFGNPYRRERGLRCGNISNQYLV